MIMECLPTGFLESNCYIIGDNNQGILIDAGAESAEVTAAVKKLGLTIKYIVLTHGHYDHICFVNQLSEELGAQVVVHEKDAEALTNPMYNCSGLFGTGYSFKEADICVKDGDVLEAGGLKFEIIHTPGHSPGSMCIKVENKLYTGDTLFREGIGRTDFVNGSHMDILNSIKNKLFKLDSSVEVYPGHGNASTIGHEIKNNPFFGGLSNY